MSYLSARTAAALLASTTLVAAYGVGAAGGADAPRETRAHAPANVAQASHAGGFAGAIDTTDRDAVGRAYKARFESNLATPIHWTGSNAHCRPGHMSARARAATLESINFVRAMGGLAPVSFSTALSAKAQKAALIMSAQRSLSHDPPRSWRCWTPAGAAAAGHSNLAYSYPHITAGGAIKQYMDDDGSSNTAGGHRRWVMNPPSTRMGNGMTATTNALWVLGPTRSTRPDPAWVSWPTAGWFPVGLQPGGRWSLSAGDDGADFSSARVHVETAGGAARAVHRYPVQTGYGEPTLVFQVKNVGHVGTFKVTVRGIRLSGRAHPVAHSYTVRLFDPDR